MEITGLDGLSRNLEGAQKALASLDGEIGQVSFDPEDAQSIELAIRQLNSMIDERIEGYEDNPFVAPLVEEMKEKYRAEILERAATARAEGEAEGE